MAPNIRDVCYFRPAPDSRVLRPHCHDCHELVLLEKGSYRARAGDRTITLQPGMLAVYPAGAEHRPDFALDRTTSLYLLQWDDDPPAFMATQTLRDPTGRALDLLAWLWQVFNTDGADARELCGSIAQTLLAHLKHRADTAARPHELLSPAMRSACAFLQADLNYNMRLQDVADVMGRSCSQTVRLFKAELGITPMQYRKNLKVQQAVRLLRSSSLRMEQIVERCGLGSLAYAYRAIKAATGTTPKRLRMRRGRRRDAG
jgi:AraC-like DNA-binding protein